jgi:hypothetical protein
MPARGQTKRARLEERLRTLGVIDEDAWADLKRELAPISDGYLRSMLIATGHPLSPVIEGVHTTDLKQAERNLRALAEEYELGDASRRRLCRDVVIGAKQRARWWLRRSAAEHPSERPLKEEILLWTSTWLENPLLFAEWVTLRRKQFATGDRRSQP